MGGSIPPPCRHFIMNDLQTLKDINEQEAATRALNAIRKSAKLGKVNRRKGSDEDGSYSNGTVYMTKEEVAKFVKGE